MSVKSLQGRRTAYATRIKLMKIKIQLAMTRSSNPAANRSSYGHQQSEELLLDLDRR